jgi:hypothetical protein
MQKIGLLGAYNELVINKIGNQRCVNNAPFARIAF